MAGIRPSADVLPWAVDDRVSDLPDVSKCRINPGSSDQFARGCIVVRAAPRHGSRKPSFNSVSKSPSSIGHSPQAHLSAAMRTKLSLMQVNALVQRNFKI
jgi:hypothetical protein